MIIINPIETEFTFELIGKNYSSLGVYTLKIKNEQTNSLSATYTATNIQNIKDVTNLTFTIEDYFIENNFYEANFYLNDSLIFKDKLFLTTQSVTDYSINNGAFVEPTISNNDYIFI